MTMSGSKVEGYTVEGEEISNIVVGKILPLHLMKTPTIYLYVD